MEAEITTPQEADLLNMSPPYIGGLAACTHGRQLLLDIYSKGTKANLSQAQRNTLRKVLGAARDPNEEDNHDQGQAWPAAAG